MKPTEYLSAVAAATEAAELHELRIMAATDPELTPVSKETVKTAVAHRFGALNGAATRNHKPRW